MSRKIILIKQELLLLVYELNRSGLLAENEKIRPILAQLEKDRKSGSAGMPRPISYAVFCLKKKRHRNIAVQCIRQLDERALPHLAVDDIHRHVLAAAYDRRRVPRNLILGEHLPHVHLHRFFFNHTATTEIYTLSLHDALPILLLVYELNRSGLLAENEKIRPILAQLEKLLLCDLSPSTNDSVKN